MSDSANRFPYDTKVSFSTVPDIRTDGEAGGFRMSGVWVECEL